jgi:hypothetical protein
MEGEHERSQLRVLDNPEANWLPEQLTVRPWPDPLIESQGYAPRSMYTELYWLPILGPSSILAFRRLGSWAECYPDGLDVSTVNLAASLGLGTGRGANSLLAKTLRRLEHFDVLRSDMHSIQVRRALPPLPERLAQRLPEDLYRMHESFRRHPSARTTTAQEVSS